MLHAGRSAMQHQSGMTDQLHPYSGFTSGSAGNEKETRPS